MSSEAINAILKETFDSEFTSKISGVPYFFENLPVTQPKIPYVIVAVVDVHTCRENIGNRLQFKKVGVINCSIHVPVDTGTKKMRQIADAIERVFLDRQIAIPGGGQVTTYESETRTRGTINGWYTMSVACNYRAHITITR